MNQAMQNSADKNPRIPVGSGVTPEVSYENVKVVMVGGSLKMVVDEQPGIGSINPIAAGANVLKATVMPSGPVDDFLNIIGQTGATGSQDSSVRVNKHVEQYFFNGGVPFMDPKDALKGDTHKAGKIIDRTDTGARKPLSMTYNTFDHAGESSGSKKKKRKKNGYGN